MQPSLLHTSTLRPQLRLSNCRQPLRASFHVLCATDGEGHSRRDVISKTGSAVAASLLLSSSLTTGAAQALFEKDMTKARRVKIPESQYTDLGDGLKSYDVRLGDGQVATVGDRVAVHYEARWKGITFRTSRQGMGVTGGSPIGFDIGTDPRYGTLPGLDQGVRGMRIGGLRKLLIPPQLAYGDKGVGGEIPAGATLEFDVELLSIKNSPFGTRVKIVEG